MEDRSSCKEVVHKCNSDPGGGRRSIGIQEDSGGGISRRTRSGSSYSHIPVARKCVLTLDGYSYVIVASPPDRSSAGEPRDDTLVRQRSPAPPPPPNRNGQLA
ncbi:uncharacterized protein LOC113468838, partial [Diaphorina citri]|uniref:Uncharacterized protein LOC113468838 n=1 Tax=Diaphorina citri TaxID=121845 RepID=A0A3Q0J4L1_DIACI